MTYNVNQLMGTTTQPKNDNDFAVARELNLLVMGLIMNVYLGDSVGLPLNHDIQDINRAYILVVNELELLYDSNPKLSAIEPEPIWKRFDVLKSSTKQIIEHVSNPDNDYGNAHFARVEKLCILANVGDARFTSEQKKAKDYADDVLTEYYEKIDEANSLNKSEKETNWLIPKYTLTYKPDGTILINNVLKLKKAHAGSTTERLLEQAIGNPNVLFKPDLGQTSRNLGTVLHSAGFTKVLRELFFPTASSSKGIVFRPTITREQAHNDKINTAELDLQLKDLGATTEPKTK